MNQDEMKEAIEECGFNTHGNVVYIDKRGSTKLAKIGEKHVEVVYDSLSRMVCVSEQIYLVECLKEYKVPYTEVLNRNSLKKGRYLKRSRRDFKRLMVTNATRILNLVDRLDSFEMKYLHLKEDKI